MCGISGYVSYSTDTSDLNKSVKAIIHRGPDAKGSLSGQLEDRYFGLGHTRLSIIDLDERANQPMVSEDQRYVLTYNGEIYNYLEIRAELEAEGEEFRTQSDTEVLLKAFEKWGPDVFTRLTGIFAAAIVDQKTGTVYLLRDQMGVKPLYYHLTEDGDLFFASELAALFAYSLVPQKVSATDLYEFLNTGFVWEPRTGFEQIAKVAPGNYLKYQDGLIEEVPYYDPVALCKNSSLDDIQKRLKAACTNQLLSDVPLALLFSGGTDSTIIANETRENATALFMRYDTSTIEKSGFVDDSDYVAQIGNEFSLNTMTIDFDEVSKNGGTFLERVRHIARKTEEPISDFTYAASEDICSIARNRGFKVVLSGMGGDEAFAGYPRHQLVHYLGNRSLLTPAVAVLGKVMRRVPRVAKKVSRLQSYLREENFALAYCRTIGYLSEEELSALVADHKEMKAAFTERLNGFISPISNTSRLKKALRLDYYGFLAHNLTVADRSSMGVGVEMRVPLLDHELYAMATSLPDKVLLRWGRTKSVLKTILKSALPRSLWNRPKTGFNPPLDEEIRSLGYEQLRDLLCHPVMSEFLRIEAIQPILDDHFSHKENNTYKIWQLLYLRCWLDQWGVKS